MEGRGDQLDARKRREARRPAKKRVKWFLGGRRDGTGQQARRMASCAADSAHPRLVIYTVSLRNNNKLPLLQFHAHHCRCRCALP